MDRHLISREVVRHATRHLILSLYSSLSPSIIFIRTYQSKHVDLCKYSQVLSSALEEGENLLYRKDKTLWNEMTDGIAMVYGCSRFSRYVPFTQIRGC